MTLKRSLGILAIVIIAAGLVAVRAKRTRQKNRAPLLQRVPPAVRVAAVQEGPVRQTHHVLGVVAGADEVALASRITAQVMEVSVREGDRVSTGQVLVRLDSRELEDAEAEAEATLAAARKAYQTQHEATARDRVLFEARAIAQEQWDRSQTREAEAQANLTVATRRLDRVATRLDYAVLRAPCAGVVSARLADPGNLALVGRPVVKLVQQKQVRVRAQVPPEDLSYLRLGQPVTLELGDQRVPGRVARVFPALQGNHLAAFEVDVQQPPAGMVSGATVGVDLELARAEGLTVPVDALLTGEKKTVVFQVRVDSQDQTTVHPVPVKVLSQSLTRAVVEGNLAAGNQVVTARPSRLMTLAEGVRVQVVDDRTHGAESGFAGGHGEGIEPVSAPAAEHQPAKAEN